MRRHLKPLSLLLSVQACTLALGLWLQNSMLLSSVQQEEDAAAWTAIEQHLDRSMDAIGRLPDDALGGTLDDGQLRKLRASLLSSRLANVLIVDDQWRVLFVSGASEASVELPWNLGDTLTWQRLGGDRAAGQSTRAAIESPSGMYLAVTARLTDDQGYVLACRLKSSDGASAAIVRRSMLATSLVGFLWIFGLQAVIMFLFFSRIHMEQSRQQSCSEKEAVRRAHDLLRTRDAVIFGLAKLAEARDTDTGQHLERIALYSQRLAEVARTLPSFQKRITPAFVRMIGTSSALHDIGKVGVDDAILLKPGKLTDDERRTMQQHTIAAGDCLRQIERRLGNSNFLEMAREIAMYHHERWDGGGYPTGLAGEQIPLAARIVSVADVYDALSSKRCYKDAFPHEQCVEMIRSEAGRQFDPEVVDVFLRVEKEFRAVAARFVDPIDAATFATAAASDMPQVDAPAADVDARGVAGRPAPQEARPLVSAATEADLFAGQSHVTETLA